MSVRLIWRAAALLALFAACALMVRPALAQTNPAAYTNCYLYNAGGQLTGKIAPAAGGGYLATRNTYNSDGLLYTVEQGSLGSWQCADGSSDSINPASWTNFSVYDVTTYAYDSMGRVISRQVSSGGNLYELTQYSYDSMSRGVCVAVRMNPSNFSAAPAACTLGGGNTPDRITHTTYDAQNHPLAVVRAYGTGSQQTYAAYTYTQNGQEQTVADANGNLTTLDYDGLDRLSEMQYPSTGGGSSSEKYAYDNDDNRVTLVTRDGQTINYSYDALNRLEIKQWPNNSTSFYYGYDLQGHRLYARFSSATGQGVTDAYDGFGEVTSESEDMGGAAETISYLYDADGDRTRVTYPDGVYIQYSYDGLDRLQSVLQNGSTNLATYSYDGDGRLEELSRGGGVAWTDYGYDAISRLSSLQHTFSSAASDVAYSLGYNPDDQITSTTISNVSYNILTAGSQNYTANALNEYSAVGGIGFSYDGRGNLTADASTTYSYDVENHLIGGGLHDATLTYDPLGRLYEISSSLGTTTFLFDGDRITAEYNGSGSLTNRYVYGVDGDDPIVWYQGSSVASPQYLFADHEGSIVAMASPSGNVFANNQYDSYGQAGSSSQNQGRFQFTGQAYVPDLGIYYYKARMYNPSLGRFMQTDPIGYTDDLDLYAYVGNDPLDRTDPSGEITEDDIDQVLLANPELGGPEIGYAIHEAVVGTEAAVRVGAALFRGVETAVEAKEVSAAVRATEIAGTMSARTQASVTIAVTETKEGTRVVSSSEGALRSGARATLKSGEVEGKGVVGTHAEANGINAAKEMGLTPTGTAASRPICASCAAKMGAQDVKPLSPLKVPAPPPPPPPRPPSE